MPSGESLYPKPPLLQHFEYIVPFSGGTQPLTLAVVLPCYTSWARRDHKWKWKYHLPQMLGQGFFRAAISVSSSQQQAWLEIVMHWLMREEWKMLMDQIPEGASLLLGSEPLMAAQAAGAGEWKAFYDVEASVHTVGDMKTTSLVQQNNSKAAL